ncbi:uncharacterized protein [Lepeophtheirus salmonis]|uniref:uncharacterized protein n=1 Tax=Lepeophtheirus salmonis TaxID=72036 RepID=UPI003AF38A63
MWNILNVKTPGVGYEKRDELQILLTFSSSGKTVKHLASETFLATKQTFFAAADLVEYLLWYRQLSEGIYYISVRQILEAEKNIGILSLVKFSGLTTSEIKGLLDEDIVRAELMDAPYLVAGYIGFSLKKKISCTSCQELMVIRDTPPDSITFDSPTNQHVGVKRVHRHNEQRGVVDSIRPSLPLLS